MHVLSEPNGGSGWRVDDHCSAAVGHLGEAMGLMFGAVQACERGDPGEALDLLRKAREAYWDAALPVMWAFTEAEMIVAREGGDKAAGGQG